MFLTIINIIYMNFTRPQGLTHVCPPMVKVTFPMEFSFHCLLRNVQYLQIILVLLPGGSGLW